MSDLVPSSSVFEMYPIGFTTIAAHLEDRGYRVRIINLALRMLKDPSFDVEAFLQKLPAPLVFGIDLHWLPHAQGALAIAEIVKRYFPNTPVLMGGFSSTYFCQELIRYPQVDFVMRGDSTEDATRQLLDVLSKGGDFKTVPNLVWKDDKGEVHANAFSYHPADLNGVDLDFRRMMVSAVRDRDLLSYLPFAGWLKYPIMPVVSCRGCIMNCVGCGGSAFAFNHIHGRQRPAYRRPDQLAEDVWKIASVSNSPIFILGDIRQAGKQYARAFLDAVKGVDVPVIIELFMPASREFMQEVSKALPDFALEVSIESHDFQVRKAFGKPYSTESIEKTFAHALDAGAKRLDIFFMTGLPYQTYDSVLQTATYAESLLQKFGTDGRIRPFIGPMAPFVDPGSRAFEEPDKHGYRIFSRSLEEHRQSLLEPSWQFTLNYETKWMTRRDIVMSTYDACLRFNEMKLKAGLIDSTQGQQAYNALVEGRALAAEIDSLRDNPVALRALRSRVNAVNMVQGVEEDKELQFSRRKYAFKWLQIVLWLGLEWLRDKKQRYFSSPLRRINTRLAKT